VDRGYPQAIKPRNPMAEGGLRRGMIPMKRRAAIWVQLEAVLDKLPLRPDMLVAQ
jgi:hypothetical protein